MTITTNHKEIGYTNNVKIIETALRERFGFDDNSHILTAVAAHIWSYICGTSDLESGNISWGTTEIETAIVQCQARLTRMTVSLQTLKVRRQAMSITGAGREAILERINCQ